MDKQTLIDHLNEDLAGDAATDKVLRRDEDNISANAAVLQYREITPENLASFHFHGREEELPVSAIIAVARDDKSGVLLEGRYADGQGRISPVRSVEVMANLLGTILTVRQYVLAAVLLVAAATLAAMALVFFLSIRLRRQEILTMTRMGAAPGRVAAILCAEIFLVLCASLLLAGILSLLAAAWGDSLFRWLLLST